MSLIAGKQVGFQGGSFSSTCKLERAPTDLAINVTAAIVTSFEMGSFPSLSSYSTAIHQISCIILKVILKPLFLASEKGCSVL